MDILTVKESGKILNTGAMGNKTVSGGFTQAKSAVLMLLSV